MVALLYFFVAIVNLVSAYKEEQYIREGMLDAVKKGPPVPKVSLQHKIIGQPASHCLTVQTDVVFRSLAESTQGEQTWCDYLCDPVHRPELLCWYQRSDYLDGDSAESKKHPVGVI
ncbi:hypothetical protein BVRB_042390 [Beta vulgaris subsp. vulgaris]|uniref:Uncharacterized protein n=1 Tax=Beta vulgaris subsp. vulgaris TaxID=3555 RepID=A0A0J7YMI4_BETVV|nr:hypothetical protein BVRB_042390 [Beta vulgaris subsp. vulgaris]